MVKTHLGMVCPAQILKHTNDAVCLVIWPNDVFASGADHDLLAIGAVEPRHELEQRVGFDTIVNLIAEGVLNIRAIERNCLSLGRMRAIGGIMRGCQRSAVTRTAFRNSDPDANGRHRLSVTTNRLSGR